MFISMPIQLPLGLITSGRSAMLREMHVSISPAEYHWPLHKVYTCIHQVAYKSVN